MPTYIVGHLTAAQALSTLIANRMPSPTAEPGNYPKRPPERTRLRAAKFKLRKSIKL